MRLTLFLGSWLLLAVWPAEAYGEEDSEEPSSSTETEAKEAESETDEGKTGASRESVEESAPAQESPTEAAPSQEAPAEEPSAEEPAAEKVTKEAPVKDAAKAFNPKVTLNFYSHLQLVVAQVGDQVTPSLQLGDVNLLVNAALTPYIDVLGEGIFELSPDRGAVPVVGRLWARATVHPGLKVTAGRIHSPIGSVVSRLPAVVGLYGLFPTMPRLLATPTSVSMTHSRLDGGEVAGDLKLGTFGTLAYNVAGGWAHGGKPTAIGRFSLNPGGKVKGLQIGGTFSIHHGASSAHNGIRGLDEETQSVAEDLYSMMVVGNASYKGGPIISAVEVYYVRNSPEAFASQADELIAVWALLGIKIRTVTPFVRYEWWTRNAQDSFYNLGGAPTEWNELVVGVNWKIDPKVVLKVAYLHGFHNDSNKGLVQLAFGFEQGVYRRGGPS